MQNTNNFVKPARTKYLHCSACTNEYFLAHKLSEGKTFQGENLLGLPERNGVHALWESKDLPQHTQYFFFILNFASYILHFPFSIQEF